MASGIRLLPMIVGVVLMMILCGGLVTVFGYCMRSVTSYEVKRIGLTPSLQHREAVGGSQKALSGFQKASSFFREG